MRDLFRAEWLKIAGNRWVAGCLIWIFPIVAFGAVVVLGLILSLSSGARDGIRQGDVPQWTYSAISVWNVLNNPVGRLILLGFTAVVFAGEYQWQTWKNVVPRNRRVPLILVKFLALGVFVVIAFVLMSLIWSLGWWLLCQIVGIPYGPKITGHILSDFAGDYALAMALAFTSTLIAAGYAALAAMLTRSILGGVLVGFALTFAESLSIVALLGIGYFLDIPRIVNLYRITPGYNLLNVASWMNDKVALNMDVDVGAKASYIFSDSLAFSVLVLAAWVLGLVALTAYLFRRQDLTS
jgi:ABC-2 type transport system permease protein